MGALSFLKAGFVFRHCNTLARAKFWLIFWLAIATWHRSLLQLDSAMWNAIHALSVSIRVVDSEDAFMFETFRDGPTISQVAQVGGKNFMIWNLTNMEDVLNGAKPRLEEVGPINMMPQAKKYDIEFFDEGTEVQYSVWSDDVFNPVRSRVLPTETVVVPNSNFVGFASAFGGEAGIMGYLASMGYTLVSETASLSADNVGNEYFKAYYPSVKAEALACARRHSTDIYAQSLSMAVDTIENQSDILASEYLKRHFHDFTANVTSCSNALTAVLYTQGISNVLDRFEAFNPTLLGLRAGAGVESLHEQVSACVADFTVGVGQQAARDFFSWDQGGSQGDGVDYVANLYISRFFTEQSATLSAACVGDGATLRDYISGAAACPSVSSSLNWLVTTSSDFPADNTNHLQALPTATLDAVIAEFATHGFARFAPWASALGSHWATALAAPLSTLSIQDAEHIVAYGMRIASQSLATINSLSSVDAAATDYASLLSAHWATAPQARSLLDVQTSSPTDLATGLQATYTTHPEYAAYAPGDVSGAAATTIPVQAAKDIVAAVTSLSGREIITQLFSAAETGFLYNSLTGTNQTFAEFCTSEFGLAELQGRKLVSYFLHTLPALAGVTPGVNVTATTDSLDALFHGSSSIHSYPSGSSANAAMKTRNTLCVQLLDSAWKLGSTDIISSRFAEPSTEFRAYATNVLNALSTNIGHIPIMVLEGTVSTDSLPETIQDDLAFATASIEALSLTSSQQTELGRWADQVAVWAQHDSLGVDFSAGFSFDASSVWLAQWAMGVSSDSVYKHAAGQEVFSSAPEYGTYSNSALSIASSTKLDLTLASSIRSGLTSAKVTALFAVADDSAALVAESTSLGTLNNAQLLKLLSYLDTVVPSLESFGASGGRGVPSLLESLALGSQSVHTLPTATSYASIGKDCESLFSEGWGTFSNRNGALASGITTGDATTLSQLQQLFQILDINGTEPLLAIVNGLSALPSDRQVSITDTIATLNSFGWSTDQVANVLDWANLVAQQIAARILDSPAVSVPLNLATLHWARSFPSYSTRVIVSPDTTAPEFGSFASQCTALPCTGSCTIQDYSCAVSSTGTSDTLSYDSAVAILGLSSAELNSFLLAAENTTEFQASCATLSITSLHTCRGLVAYLQTVPLTLAGITPPQVPVAGTDVDILLYGSGAMLPVDPTSSDYSDYVACSEQLNSLFTGTTDVLLDIDSDTLRAVLDTMSMDGYSNIASKFSGINETQIAELKRYGQNGAVQSFKLAHSLSDTDITADELGMLHWALGTNTSPFALSSELSAGVELELNTFNENFTATPMSVSSARQLSSSLATVPGAIGFIVPYLYGNTSVQEATFGITAEQAIQVGAYLDSVCCRRLIYKGIVEEGSGFFVARTIQELIVNPKGRIDPLLGIPLTFASHFPRDSQGFPDYDATRRFPVQTTARFKTGKKNSSPGYRWRDIHKVVSSRGGYTSAHECGTPIAIQAGFCLKKEVPLSGEVRNIDVDGLQNDVLYQDLNITHWTWYNPLPERSDISGHRWNWRGMPVTNLAPMSALDYLPSRLYPTNDILFQDMYETGLLNKSSMLGGAPVFISRPHFLAGSQSLRDAVEGMNPNISRHYANLAYEDRWGIIVDVKRRLQYNYGFDGIITGFEGFLPVYWLDSEITLPDLALTQMKAGLHDTLNIAVGLEYSLNVCFLTLLLAIHSTRHARNWLFLMGDSWRGKEVPPLTSRDITVELFKALGWFTLWSMLFWGPVIAAAASG